MTRLSKVSQGLLVATATWSASVGASGADAQMMFAGPEIGRSERRGLALGARVGRRVLPGLDVVGQGLLYFPDEGGVAEPEAVVERDAWQASANVLYTFDGSRALAPYVGVGGRYGRADLSVTFEGLRASDVRTGFELNLIGGLNLPNLPGRPFLEYRGGGEGGYVVTGGVRLAVSGG